VTGVGGRATLALLALAALLAMAVAVELLGRLDEGGPTPARSVGNDQQVAASGTPALPVVDRAQWTATALSRPLFSRSRRPPAMSESAPAAAAGMPRLAGVVVNGADRSAILVPAEGGRAVVAREGTRIGGITVQAIQAGQVTILAPSGARILRPTLDPNRLVPSPAGTSAEAPGAPPLLSGLPPPPLPPGAAR